MIPLPFLKNKKILMIGFGRSGKAVVTAALASGAQVYLYDTRVGICEHAKSLFPLINVITENIRFSMFDEIAVSPFFAPYAPEISEQSTPLVTRAVRENVTLTSEADLFFRSHPKGMVFGVSGTNGKSSTVSLLQFALANIGYTTHLGGNIGIPLLSLSSPQKNDMTVVELSSSQLEICPHLCLDAAIMLPFSHDHAARYHTYDDYVATKRFLFQQVKPGGVALYCADDPYQKSWLTLPALQHVVFVPYSTQRVLKDGFSLIDNQLWPPETIPSWNCQKKTEKGGKEVAVPTSCLQHSPLSVLGTFALLRLLGQPRNPVVHAMENWPGLPHRQERFMVNWHALKSPLLCIDDSIATNANAAAFALQSVAKLNKPVVWFCGGTLKGDPLEQLLPYLKNNIMPFCFGVDGSKLHSFFKTNGLKSVLSVTLAQAVQKAKAHVKTLAENKKDLPVLLLSPVGASFDAFQNFEDRGKHFKALMLQTSVASTHLT